MRFTVLPISGGGAVSQMCLLSLLEKRPKIMLGSSGGNLAAYVSLASQFDINGIERNLRCVSSDMILSNWWPKSIDFMPSYIAGYSRGSWYDSGAGFTEFFEGLFSPYTVSSTEIWTGTTDCLTSRSQLWCNRAKGKSILSTDNYTLEEFNSMPLEYLNSNIQDIATVSLASASIPSLVPCVNFRGKRYTDGGATNSSPLGPMIPILRTYENLHIDYINSFDLQDPSEICSSTIGTMIRTATSEMIHASITNDRAMGIELIRKCSDSKLNYVQFSCCPSFLREISIFRKKCKRTMLELYPDVYRAVTIDNYSFAEAKKVIDIGRDCYRARFWWLGDSNLKEENPDLFECQEKCTCLS